HTRSYGDWSSDVCSSDLEVVDRAAHSLVYVLIEKAHIPLQKGERIIFLGDSITAGGVRPTGYVTLIKEALTAKHKDLGIEVIGRSEERRVGKACRARRAR